MATLATDSACDNMYLEFVLALELRERSSLDKIFPLMLGDKDDATGKYGRFTFRGANPCYPTKWPEVAVESVDAKLRERLDDMELGMPLVDAMTVTDVLAGVMKYQGAYIEGDLEDALKVIIENKIVHMRRSHDKAVHDALEAENKAASQAASQAAGTGGSATGKSPKIHGLKLPLDTGADSKRGEGSMPNTPKATSEPQPNTSDASAGAGADATKQHVDKGNVGWAPSVVSGGSPAAASQQQHLDLTKPPVSSGFVTLGKSSQPTIPGCDDDAKPGGGVVTKPTPSLMSMFGLGSKPVAADDQTPQSRRGSSLRITTQQVNDASVRKGVTAAL